MSTPEQTTARLHLQRLPELLKRPADDYTQSSLRWCLNYAWDEAKPFLAPLRYSEHWELVGTVTKCFVEHDCDEGTMQILRDRMLEPGVQESRRAGRLLQELSLSLGWWCDPRHAKHRSQAIALALEVLGQSLAAPDSAERLNTMSDGWFYTERLIDGISQQDSTASPAMLARIVGARALNAAVRAHAMTRLVDLTGVVPPQRSEIIASLLSGPGRSGSDLVQNLTRRKLVELPELLPAAGHPDWAYPVCTAIDAFPLESMDAPTVMDGLIASLEKHSSDFVQRSHYLGSTLQRLPRTPEQDKRISALIRFAVAQHEKALPTFGYMRDHAAGHLLTFGGSSSVHAESLEPWDATRQQWMREGISWATAAEMLVGNGAIDPVPAETIAKVEKMTGFAQAFMELCGNRMAHVMIRDGSYEFNHDKLFAKLCAIVRPPIMLDSVRESEEEVTEDDELQVEFTHQQHRFQFAVHPEGSSADLGAVAAAFDAFMAQLGRPERTHCMPDPWDDSEGALVLCADSRSFPDIDQTLRLPLSPKVAREYPVVLKRVQATRVVKAKTAVAPASPVDESERLFEEGLRYFHGYGVKQSSDRARQSWERAAELGHPLSMNNLATIYSNGDGVPVDVDLAFEWQHRAADTNHAFAQLNLGKMHLRPELGRFNRKLARHWLGLAAAQGDKVAADLIVEFQLDQSVIVLSETLSRLKRKLFG